MFSDNCYWNWILTSISYCHNNGPTALLVLQHEAQFVLNLALNARICTWRAIGSIIWKPDVIHNVNMHIKFGEIHPCGFRDMPADRHADSQTHIQTDRQTRSSQYLSEVKWICSCHISNFPQMTIWPQLHALRIGRRTMQLSASRPIPYLNLCYANLRVEAANCSCFAVTEPAQPDGSAPCPGFIWNGLGTQCTL